MQFTNQAKTNDSCILVRQNKRSQHTYTLTWTYTWLWSIYQLINFHVKLLARTHLKLTIYLDPNLDVCYMFQGVTCSKINIYLDLSTLLLFHIIRLGAGLSIFTLDLFFFVLYFILRDYLISYIPLNYYMCWKTIIITPWDNLRDLVPFMKHNWMCILFHLNSPVIVCHSVLLTLF